MMTDFMTRFGVPGAALPVIDRIVTPLEQKVLEHLPDVFRAEDVQAALGGASGREAAPEDAKAFTAAAYRRGVFSLENEAEGRYQIGSFYSRLDIFSVTANEAYKSFAPAVRKALDDWYFAAYLASLPVGCAAPTDDAVVSLEETLAGIDRDPRPLYLAPCDCRCLSGECGKPLLTCLSYRGGPNTFAHRGVSRLITKEEGKRIVRLSHEAGLIHTRNAGGICNCCEDCCYLFRARKVRNSGFLWPKSAFAISLDAEKCLSCGACVERCPFGALCFSEGTLAADPNQCVGCGLCAGSCPTGALRLTERV